MEEPLSPFCALGCNMSLQLHFLQYQLDYLGGNMEAVHDQHSGRFHQDISQMEKRYSAKRNPNIGS